MDQCCPSPQYPIIQPDERAKKLRQFLKCLYFGQIFICLIKYLLFGAMACLFQMINLWVIYTAYATMHFCSVLIYLIMCCFDLMFITMDYKRLTSASETEDSTFVAVLFVIMGIYYAISIFYSYRAYVHYKTLFMLQLGDVYQLQEQNPYSDQEQAYQQQQRQMREQFYARQQEQMQRQEQLRDVEQAQLLQRQNPEVSRYVPPPEATSNSTSVPAAPLAIPRQEGGRHNTTPEYPNHLGDHNFQPPNVVVHDFRKKPYQPAQLSPQGLSQNVQEQSKPPQPRQGSSGFQAFSGVGHRLD